MNVVRQREDRLCRLRPPATIPVWADEVTMAHAMLCQYGLLKGQCRDSGRRVHNGVWFNHRWQMIGWGDLADQDFQQVAKAIPFGELFIVSGTPPYNGVEQCSWIVEHGRVYAVLDQPREGEGFYRLIDREAARGIIARIARLHR
jgi:hypothetical protein